MPRQVSKRGTPGICWGFSTNGAFRVPGSRTRPGLNLRELKAPWTKGFRVEGLGFRFLGLRASGLGFRVYGFGFRV